MLDKQPLTLAHPRVQAAKAQWDAAVKRKPPRHSLSFEELFEYFKADCVRQARVAELAGLTRERIRQIYDRYFRELFDDKGGIERVHACTLENRLVKVKQSEGELFGDPLVKKIVEKALAVKCTVEAIPCYVNGTLSGKIITTELLIGGHRCSLHRTKRAWRGRGSKRLYAHIGLTLNTNIEAFIVHVEAQHYPERTFVIPASVLLAAYTKRSSSSRLNISLPTEKLPIYKNQRPRVDYWQYEEAWHLLLPDADAPVP